MNTETPKRTLSHPFIAVGMPDICRKAIVAEKMIFDELGRSPIRRMVGTRTAYSVNAYPVTVKIDAYKKTYTKGRPHKFNFLGLKEPGFYFVVDNYKKHIFTMGSCIKKIIENYHPDWKIKREKFGDKLKVIRTQ